MATMASRRSAITRREVWLLKVRLDRCTLENLYMYAAAITCTATAQCHYTYPTCKDTPNYDKSSHEFLFCNEGARITGALPLLVRPSSPLTTEISEKDFKSTRGQFKFKLTGDTAMEIADPDKLFDAAKQSEAEDTGRFWPNFLRRNRNYHGRIIELYYGFDNVDVDDFELKFRGIIEDINFTQGSGVEITAKDLLWNAVTQKAPKKTPSDITVADNPLGAGAATVNLDKDGSTNFTTSNYFEAADYDTGSGTTNQYRFVKIEDELIAYKTITDGAGADLADCVRGVMGTTAAAHDQGTKIEQVEYYGVVSAGDAAWSDVEGVLPAHVLYDLLCNLGNISAAYMKTHTTDISSTCNGAVLATDTTITANNASDLPGEGIVKINDELIRYAANDGADLTGCKRGCYGTTAAAHGDTDEIYPLAAAYWLGEWWAGALVKGRFESSKKVKEFVNVLKEDLMLHVWVDDDGEVDCIIPLPIYLSSPTALTMTNILEAKRKVDYGDAMRVTRVGLYYNPPEPDPSKGPDGYSTDAGDGDQRWYIDAEAEGVNSYNEETAKVIYGQFIYRQVEANVRVAREFMRNREARPEIEVTLEAKDEDIKVGDIVSFQIPEIVDDDGSERLIYMRVLMKKAARVMGQFVYRLLDLGYGTKRYCLISDDANDYDSAAVDTSKYGWIGNADNEVGAAGDDGYYIW